MPGLPGGLLPDVIPRLTQALFIRSTMNYQEPGFETRKKEYIEKVGVVMEQMGFQRMVGRVLGYLMISEPPYKTFTDIQEYLQASKSSISTSLQLLLTQGLVVYFTQPGDRKRYFKLNSESWLAMVKREAEQFETLRNLLLECLALRSNDYPQFNTALSELADLYAFMMREIPPLIDRWLESRRSN
jgi:DNA-binding MarR family transcriptional regulator